MSLSRKRAKASSAPAIGTYSMLSDLSSLLVVTSDKPLKGKVDALGASVVSSRVFRDRLDAALGGDCF